MRQALLEAGEQRITPDLAYGERAGTAPGWVASNHTKRCNIVHLHDTRICAMMHP
jgi:hypothetical protein